MCLHGDDVIRFFVCSASILLDLGFRAKLGDFGMACAVKEYGSTRAHTVVETSGYFPPEYYRGEITTRMDTYSFGVVRRLDQYCMEDSAQQPKHHMFVSNVNHAKHTIKSTISEEMWSIGSGGNLGSILE